METIERQAAQLERDLIAKEQKTLNILKELEAAKKYVEGLKVKLIMPAFMASPELKMESRMNVNGENSTDGLSLCSVLSPGFMFMELNQAKLNLNKTSGDLAMIQASVESLNEKMRREKLLLERRNEMQIPNSKGIVSLEQNHRVSERKMDVHQKAEMAYAPDNSMTICKELKQVNFEAEQFKKMTEASRYEVIKAMTEIERTKNSIRMAEMRLNAAKKMEEAAKAVEVIALAERKALLKDEKPSDGFLHEPARITLSFEEYRALTQKAQQAEDLCKTKFIDTNAIQRIDEAHQLEVPVLEKFEQNATDNTQSCKVDLCKEEGPHRTNIDTEDYYYSRLPPQQCEKKFTDCKFRNSHPADRNPPGNELRATKEGPMHGFRTTTSIGDILSRKLILQDDVMVERHVENHSERQHVSLSQMLREQSRLILHSEKPTTDGNVEKQFVIQRKKFGFIQVPLRAKQSKKKMQPLNMR